MALFRTTKYFNAEIYFRSLKKNEKRINAKIQWDQSTDFHPKCIARIFSKNLIFTDIEY